MEQIKQMETKKYENNEKTKHEDEKIRSALKRDMLKQLNCTNPPVLNA